METILKAVLKVAGVFFCTYFFVSLYGHYLYDMRSARLMDKLLKEESEEEKEERENNA